MSFNWGSSFNNNEQEIDVRLCPASPEENNVERKVVLGVEMHHIPAVGCCGESRSDIIYGVGYTSDFEQFKKEALAIASKYEEEKDIYSLEYFYGESAQNERGRGKSIYKLENRHDKWNFFEKGVNKLLAKTYEELVELWG